MGGKKLEIDSQKIVHAEHRSKRLIVFVHRIKIVFSFRKKKKDRVQFSQSTGT